MQFLSEADQLDRDALRAIGFDLTLFDPYWIRIAAPSKSAAYKFATKYSDTLSRWAQRWDVFITYENQSIRIGSTTMSELLSLPVGGQMKVNSALLDIFGRMLSSPERSLGLVRLQDERQISVSGGADGKYLAGASVDQVTQWKRRDYWHPEDLENFNRDWQQSMSADSDQWFEYSYRSFDPLAPVYRRGPEFCDFEFVSRYRLIEGPGRTLYHLAENMDMVEIATAE